MKKFIITDLAKGNANITTGQVLEIGGGTFNGIETVDSAPVTFTGDGTIGTPLSLTIEPVSATQSGIVNNTSLQELGGVDKKINGVRVGRGGGNKPFSTAFGYNSLNNITSGIDNTGLGAETLEFTTTGSQNTAVGEATLWHNISGTYNSGLGAYTLQNNTTGSRNIAVGTSLYWNSTGNDNTGIGFNALHANNTGSFNTAVGRSAGYVNGVGSYNTLIGGQTFGGAGYESAPSAINYNRNVIIGYNITAIDGTNDTLVIDNKGATATSPANALIYGGFSVANRFVNIGGKLSVTPAMMPTADGTYTKTIVAKPDGAFGWEDKISSEFVKITEGANTGWGLKYRVGNSSYYGNIGNGAIDLSFNNSSSSTVGATGTRSVVSGGYINTASGYNSTVSGGAGNTAIANQSTISGGSDNTASGLNSTVSGGLFNSALSFCEWVGGVYSTLYTPSSPSAFVATDRLFNIGNGTVSLRSDAFTILKNGLATLPSVTNALIDAEPTGKAVVTKEYVNKANSYSTDEIKTGGTWIDDKDIYTITQLTADPAPTVDTMIKSIVVGGTYTEYEYTKP